MFFVEQRSRFGSVKAERFPHGVLPLGEVIHRLGNIRKKNLEALGQGHVGVTIVLQSRTRVLGDLLCLFGIARLWIAKRAHVYVGGHMLVVVAMAVAHGLRGCSQVPAYRGLTRLRCRTALGVRLQTHSPPTNRNAPFHPLLPSPPTNRTPVR